MISVDAGVIGILDKAEYTIVHDTVILKALLLIFFRQKGRIKINTVSHAEIMTAAELGDGGVDVNAVFFGISGGRISNVDHDKISLNYFIFVLI